MIKKNKIISFFTFKKKDGSSKTIPLFSVAIQETIRKVRRHLQDIMWSIAIASGVTPKKIAKNLADKEKVNKFAENVVTELGKEKEKKQSKAAKELEKETGAKVVKRGRPRKSTK